MGQVKELNIKNQTYYFFDYIINIKNFHSNLLKIDKKLYKDIDIYYIGYITIKKFGEKYLIHDLIEKYEEVFSGIRSEIKTVNDGKKTFL